MLDADQAREGINQLRAVVDGMDKSDALLLLYCVIEITDARPEITKAAPAPRKRRRITVQPPAATNQPPAARADATHQWGKGTAL